MQTKPSPVNVDRDATTAAARVSVVIPAYNSSAYLGEALQSVLAQSAPAAEIIVVDDGSTDDTAQIARSFGVRVLSLPNGGPSAARNAGTQAASGEYIAYLDADDVWPTEKLAVQLAALQSFARPAFAFTDYRIFDEHGVYERSELLNAPAFRKIAGNTRGVEIVVIAGNDSRPVLYDSYIPPSSVLVRRADALAVGGFDETLRITEDYEFFLRLLRIVPAIAVMRPLLLYRKHHGQATAKQVYSKAGFLEVARRVAGSPDRYPRGDAQYIARTGFLRHYRVGIAQARLGDFDGAVESLRQSLAERRTVRASLVLLGARVGRGPVGSGAFTLVRTLWKSRPGRR